MKINDQEIIDALRCGKKVYRLTWRQKECGQYNYIVLNIGRTITRIILDNDSPDINHWIMRANDNLTLVDIAADDWTISK